MSCNVQVLSDAEFLPYLESKLREELEEYELSRSVVELADLIEVIYRISELRNTSVDELELIRLEKRGKRGARARAALHEELSRREIHKRSRSDASGPVAASTNRARVSTL